jgi:dolichyl-phosphate beta-glucosyltransferase
MDAGAKAHTREGPVTSLVFPTYNPGQGVERTWSEVREFLQEAPGRWEVIFVCDGCSDGSPDRLVELSRNDSERVRVLSYLPNRGKGFAVRQGLSAASGAWRIFTDVDLAYGFADVLRIADELRAGAEVVIASRTHPGSQILLPARLLNYVYRRHLQSQVFSALARTLLPIEQRDTQAGLKGFTRNAVEALLPHLACNGFGFDCELLTACKYLDISVAEIPVCLQYDNPGSTTGIQGMGKMIAELWRIRRRWQHFQLREGNSAADSIRRAA